MLSNTEILHFITQCIGRTKCSPLNSDITPWPFAIGIFSTSNLYNGPKEKHLALKQDWPTKDVRYDVCIGSTDTKQVAESVEFLVELSQSSQTGTTEKVSDQ